MYHESILIVPYKINLQYWFLNIYSTTVVSLSITNNYTFSYILFYFCYSHSHYKCSYLQEITFATAYNTKAYFFNTWYINIQINIDRNKMLLGRTTYQLYKQDKNFSVISFSELCFNISLLLISVQSQHFEMIQKWKRVLPENMHFLP